MDYSKSTELRELSHSIIPGGCHTYAKGDDQFPDLSPGFIQRGQGCHVWDVDGNEFIEYGMGNERSPWVMRLTPSWRLPRARSNKGRTSPGRPQSKWNAPRCWAT